MFKSLNLLGADRTGRVVDPRTCHSVPCYIVQERCGGGGGVVYVWHQRDVVEVVWHQRDVVKVVWCMWGVRDMWCVCVAPERYGV